MPIPDAVLPPEPETEAEAAHRLRREAVFAACNALLAKQIECKIGCHICNNKCQELQTWLNVGED